MRLVRFLALLLLLLVGLAAVFVLAGPWEVDLSERRETISSLVRDHTGWELEIQQGPVLRLSSQVAVSASGVNLHNPAWPKRQESELFRADQLSVAMDIWPLLFGRLETAAGRLSDARLAVSWDAAGRMNWQPKGGASTQPEDVPSGLAWRLPDQVDLQIDSTQVDYLDARTDTRFQLQIASAQVKTEGKDEDIQLALDAELEGTPLDFSGRVGRFHALVSGDAPYPVDVQGNILGVSLNAVGHLVNPESGADARLKVNLAADSMAGFRPWLGKATAEVEPFRAELQLQGGDSKYTAKPLELDMGKTRLRGDAELNLSEDRPHLRFSSKSQEIDLTPWLDRYAAKPASEADSAKGPATDPAVPANTRLFSDAPVPLDWMHALNLDIHKEIETLRARGAKVAKVQIVLNLKDGLWKSKVDGVIQDDRKFAWRFSVDSRPRKPIFSLNLDGDDLDLSRMAAVTRTTGGIQGDMELVVELRGEGRSLREIMGSLDGIILALVNDGRANVRQLDAVIGGAGALLGQLVTSSDQLAKVNCSLNGIFLEQGRGKVDILLDTEYSVVVGAGNLDLRAETIDMKVTPKPKGVTLSVASPVLVKGPLSAPSYELEKTGILIKLTDLVAKIAVPHLVLVDAFGDELEGSPCAALISGDKTASDLASGKSGAVRSVASGTGSLVTETGATVKKGTGNAVKGMLGFGRSSSDDAAESPSATEKPPVSSFDFH